MPLLKTPFHAGVLNSNMPTRHKVTNKNSDVVLYHVRHSKTMSTCQILKEPLEAGIEGGNLRVLVDGCDGGHGS
jgi:hypothetical protein